jgi:ATPase subunit of ABC transporter with duplicated ATPase domains
MSRPKKLVEPYRTNVVIEKSVFIEIQQRHGNFSEWVRQKAEEDLTAQNDISETQIKLAQAEQKRKEAEILKQRADHEARELELRLNSLKSPGPTIRKIQENKLDQALKTIANAETPERRFELCQVWAKILTDAGLEVTAHELLGRVENERNGMYG